MGIDRWLLVRLSPKIKKFFTKKLSKVVKCSLASIVTEPEPQQDADPVPNLMFNIDRSFKNVSKSNNFILNLFKSTNF
jgi:hypothetical protein